MAIPKQGEKRNLSKTVEPFLKWPGGKRWLVPHLMKLVSDLEFKRYFEPFAGGGAFFFALRPTRATLSDVNADLINTYTRVKYEAPELTRRLVCLPVNQETYYRIRAVDPIDSMDRAVRFLYLNRTAFGGMYRLNRQGRFNVPYGGGQRSHSILWKRDLLRSASRILRNSRLLIGDFQHVLEEADCGDLVYCDPTYTVSHSNNGFVRYNEVNFRWQDQQRLADTCADLRNRGVTVLVSNAVHAAVTSIFNADEVHMFSRSSTICPRSASRRTVQEHVFVFRPK